MKIKIGEWSKLDYYYKSLHGRIKEACSGAGRLTCSHHFPTSKGNDSIKAQG